MNAPLVGRVTLNAADGRAPWDGLHAAGEAIVASDADPLSAILELDRRSATGRYAGFFSYDLGRAFETLPVRVADDVPVPLAAFVPVVEDDRDVTSNFGALTVRRGDLSRHATTDHAARTAQRIGSTFSRDEYEDAVRRCLDYIAAGDVFQVNLSQRLAVPTDAAPHAVYAHLRERFPAAYGGCLAFGDVHLLCNSPELFLRVTRLPDGRRKIVNRPIKGTRPNAAGMHAELLASEKEKAELAMIVDLQRNDLGRICEIGSVIVTEPRIIETHPTVLHGVATVEGILRDGVTLADILRATFPCGSVTGCPKIRAMEVIEELEPVRRGAYCGAIGWIGGGEMELAVSIRTMTIVSGIAYVPVGGGIVADSDPAAEYHETMTKAAAMLAALGVKPL